MPDDTEKDREEESRRAKEEEEFEHDKEKAGEMFTRLILPDVLPPEVWLG